MKPPGPAKGVPPTPRPEAAAPRREAPPAPGQACELTLRYYCSMRRWQVHSLVVSLARPARGPTPGVVARPLVVRPVIPGAQVVPAELSLDPSRPADQVAFDVTPLARGRLHGARVEVHQQGELIQTVRLRTRSITHLLTWTMLLLTFVLPGLLLYTTVYRPLDGTIRQPKIVQENTARGDGADAPPPAFRTVTDEPPLEIAGDPGSRLARVLRDFVTENMPAFPGRDYLTDSSPERGDLSKTDLAWLLGAVYQLACQAKHDHLSFWVAMMLLGLTVLSWVARRRQRTSLRKSLLLPLAPTADQAGETLPLNQNEVVAVQPV